MKKPDIVIFTNGRYYIIKREPRLVFLSMTPGEKLYYDTMYSFKLTVKRFSSFKLFILNLVFGTTSKLSIEKQAKNKCMIDKRYHYLFKKNMDGVVNDIGHFVILKDKYKLGMVVFRCGRDINKAYFKTKIMISHKGYHLLISRKKVNGYRLTKKIKLKDK